MPQVFPPSSNFFARASIAAAILFLGAAALVLVFFYPRSSSVTAVGVTPSQPVPFPHSFHVGTLGLDCRYCHMSVDKSSFADFPPTQTCMSCHSQVALTDPVLAPVRQSYQTGQPIAWKSVYQLPAYVYFSHDIHVAKGVGCETCHGRMDEMSNGTTRVTPLTMEWCLSCHNDPSKYLRPVADVYQMGYQPQGDQQTIGRQLMQEYHILPASQLTNCSTCHR
ncbi:MAG TPA: cytochrome c3 family protein [Anaerolineaceae bacterium]